MALEIRWTRRADIKFDRTLEYLSLEWGEAVTKSFVKKVYDFLEILSEYPQIGMIENRERGIRGFAITEQVSIFYRIEKEEVIIVNFFDNRQNPNKKNNV